ncbi:MAG: M56 family metallopeptidase [Candidatus Sulfopaludibacter sp.]|nr:M56 family metallopeptidase [Candidatus Sulfopaludibacter sp.]
MTSLLWPLANHLWQSTLFAGAAGLLTLALRTNRARVRHWVWLTASCKFLIPLAVLIALGGQIQWRPAAGTARSNVAMAMDRVSRPFTAPAVSHDWPAAAPVPAASLLPEILFGIWACGFLGIAGSWWIRWRRLRAAVWAGEPLHLDIPIPARSSPTALEPGIFGVFRPLLVLPEGIFERLPPEQLEAVIAHEMSHVRRRDNLTAAVHMLVETVFWFHPLVWFIGRRMVSEREHACDEEVLRLGNAPKVYAEGILNVCKLYVESPLACASGVTGADLKNRIAAIMTNRTGRRLNFARKLALAAAGAAALAAPLVLGMMNAPAIRAQAAAAGERPSFEVASVKPAAGGPGISIGIDRSGEFHTRNTPLLTLIAYAYGVQSFQVYGAPAWVRSEAYDIVAKREVNKPEGPPQKESIESMSAGMKLRVQMLLEERCRLRMHHETKELPVVALVAAKGGPKLQPSNCVTVDPQNPPQLKPGEPRPAFCGNLGQHKSETGFTLTGTGITMGDFVHWLAAQTGRTIIDRTGYTANFNFTMEWTPDTVSGIPGLEAGADAAAPSSDPGGPSLASALQQLGLRMESTKGPVDVLVIDRVEKPSGN